MGLNLEALAFCGVAIDLSNIPGGGGAYGVKDERNGRFNHTINQTASSHWFLLSLCILQRESDMPYY